LENKEERRYPVPPLITSTLQQAASSRLKYSPQKTMKIAQELYEGIGGKGLITYMRTDAVTLSPEFIEDARGWIRENAPQALADTAPTFKVKAEAQGAHEAIRPTSADMTPSKARGILNDEQHAVYRLIWERAIASQCKPARISRGQIEIHAGTTRWIARGLTVLDPGYLIFWKNIEEEKELPRVAQGQTLKLENISIEAKKTQPPSRYSEAKLIQIMEKLGIGRPSTYASTVNTIRERGYVILEKDVLAPTELGMGTDEFLMRAMPDIVNVAFTAQMEGSLDRIAEGKLAWEAFLCEWNGSYLQAALVKARAFLRSFPVTKIEPPAGIEKSAGGYGKFKGKRKFSKPRAARKAATGGDAKPKRAARAAGGKKAAGAKPGTKKAVASGERSGSSAPFFKPVSSAAPAGPAPVCTHGHGPLEGRTSKKGAPYWKCKQGGCDSWAWPGKPVQGSIPF
jgi:DNA topoisomerase-1